MNENKIISSLPLKNNGNIDWKLVVGMKLDLLYNNKIYNVEVVDYHNYKLFINYNGYMNKKGIQAGNFAKGIFGGVLGITHHSKNKFEYSEEHGCWLGWTQKGEKFAFDGDDETVEYIMKQTWYAAKNCIYCSRRVKTLVEVVYGEKNDKQNVLSHISNDLGLTNKWYDNRRCNIKENKQSQDTRAWKIGKNYKYELIDKGDFYIVSLKNGDFKLSKTENTQVILDTWACDIVEMNCKKYVSCRDCNGNNNKLLHRVLFGLIGSRYKKWYIDHLNGDGLDNRMENLLITDHYGNMCNRKSDGYIKTTNGTYYVQFMKHHPDDKLFLGKSRTPTFKTEEEAIAEVERRRKYILENRIKFYSKAELDEYLNDHKFKEDNKHNK